MSYANEDLLIAKNLLNLGRNSESLWKSSHGQLPSFIQLSVMEVLLRAGTYQKMGYSKRSDLFGTKCGKFSLKTLSKQ